MLIILQGPQVYRCSLRISHCTKRKHHF